ncbi:hypothetical protein [Streptobacillus felis]|uniref:hypothetical protein n=2 Tax=Streptobacillus felis TaxID=1384509 RepID=UPI00082D326A|nr:hypothetical protein [Streptobacillus felis]
MGLVLKQKKLEIVYGLLKNRGITPDERIDKFMDGGGRLAVAGGKLILIGGVSLALDTLGVISVPVTLGISLPVSQGLKFIGDIVISGQTIFVANELNAGIQKITESITGKEIKYKQDLREYNSKLYDNVSEILDYTSIGIVAATTTLPKENKKT